MNDIASNPSSTWLRNYYLTRAAVSLLWIVLALSVGKASPAAGGILLIAYPAWDALANYIDGGKSGGLGRNRTQRLNFVLSLFVALVIGLTLAFDTSFSILVFGFWAIAAGLLQLIAAVKRWKVLGGQWAMILSGAQSALAGGFFVKKAIDGTQLDASVVAPYAAFGAFYFLVSAVWLAVKKWRNKGLTSST
jgi:hypothetical protein